MKRYSQCNCVYISKGELKSSLLIDEDWMKIYLLTTGDLLMQKADLNPPPEPFNDSILRRIPLNGRISLQFAKVNRIGIDIGTKFDVICKKEQILFKKL